MPILVLLPLDRQKTTAYNRAVDRGSLPRINLRSEPSTAGSTEPSRSTELLTHGKLTTRQPTTKLRPPPGIEAETVDRANRPRPSVESGIFFPSPKLNGEAKPPPRSRCSFWPKIPTLPCHEPHLTQT